MSNVTKTNNSKNRHSLDRKEKALKKVTLSDELTVTYQKFNGSYQAVISNLTDRHTHAFGRTKLIAGKNALKNFRIKYGAF